MAEDAPTGELNADSKVWRLLDTGDRCAAENIALDATLLEARIEGKIPNTLRLLKFKRPAALVGYHQSIAQEIRSDYCNRQEIDINRRITGGGAVLLDQGQIGWELIASKRQVRASGTMAELTALICAAAIRALELLGVSASFRPRNDIEVGGRKICGTGGSYEGDFFLFQGTLLVDFDTEAMVKALRIPTEKLSHRELSSASERVICLSDILADVPAFVEIKAAFKRAFSEIFAVTINETRLSDAEARRAAEALPEYQSVDWLNLVDEPIDARPVLRSLYRGRGGIIRTAAAVDTGSNRLKSVVFSGDFFIEPRRVLFDLESRLRDTPLEDVPAAVEQFFLAGEVRCLDLDAGDFVAAVKAALAKTEYASLGISGNDLNSISLVGTTNLAGILERASYLLLPYCAKLTDCEYRERDGCDECGDCSVGDACAAGRKRGLKVICVHNYEEFINILEDCRFQGATAYIGCCCQAFLAKHYQDFAASGLDAALVDIDNTTCYELNSENLAYRGQFRQQTNLKLGLLNRLLELIPDRSATTNNPAGKAMVEK